MSQTHTTPVRARLWAPAEIHLEAAGSFANPFVDVEVTAHLHSPSGRTLKARAFFAGDDSWLIRFAPDETGRWSFTTLASPEDPGLQTAGRVDVAPPPADARGMLQLTVEPPWNAAFSSGKSPYLLGDTIYNLLGAAHCGLDVEALLAKRREQGFNVIRCRVPVSPFHPPEAYNRWQNRDVWPWGGSPQCPLLDRFNLDYFATAERVMELGLRLGLGFELVLEAWMFEFPFNRRDLFTAELEALWLRYVVSRLAAYPSVYLWTVALAYERYPDGRPAWNPLVDRWAAGLARQIQSWDPHRRPVGVDAGLTDPPVTGRFQRFPELSALYHPVAWPPEERKKTAGMAAQAPVHLTDSGKLNVVTLPGYARCDTLSPTLPEPRRLDGQRLLRAVWTAFFAGAHALVGFENTWGPRLDPAADPPVAGQLRHLARFAVETPFPDLLPGPARVGVPGEERYILASRHSPFVAAYLPETRICRLEPELLPGDQAGWRFSWYETATGAWHEATAEEWEGAASDRVFAAPAPQETGHGLPAAGWVLVAQGVEA